jgi:hypothetical protein
LLYTEREKLDVSEGMDGGEPAEFKLEDALQERKAPEKL